MIDLAAGRLEGERLSAATAHLDDCPDCRRVIGALGSQAQSATSPEGSASEVSDPLGRGKAVGRYLLLDLLGKGSMGEVHIAYHPELRRRVALKMLKVERAQSPESRARFTREAYALARISHPNVVAVHDVGTHADRTFIAMDYVEGQTLGDWLDERRSWRSVLAAFRAAGRGLAAAHSVGVVHRDFKPENVLVSAEGRVCVTDFGLAHQVEETGEQELTRPGALVGTPAYMSPEQFRGQPANAQSDQFSFCVALFEALYGERPFRGKNLKELGTDVVSGQLRTPKKKGSAPEWVWRIVRRGLRVPPAERYPSIQALLDDIERGERRYVLFGPAVARIVGVLLWLALVLLARFSGDVSMKTQIPGLYLYAVIAVAILVVQRMSRRFRRFAPFAIPVVDIPLVWWQRRQLLLPAVLATAREPGWATAAFSASFFLVLLAMSVMSLDPAVVVAATLVSAALQFDLSHTTRPDYPLGAVFHMAPMLVVGAIGAIATFRLRALIRAGDSRSDLKL